LIVDGEAKVEEAPSTILYEPKPASSGLHPSTKPVALIERLLSNKARGGDLVIDAFGGSGSTMIAADRVGMSARLVELEPRYVDTICQRYWQYTGRRPTHASMTKAAICSKCGALPPLARGSKSHDIHSLIGSLYRDCENPL